MAMEIDPINLGRQTRTPWGRRAHYGPGQRDDATDEHCRLLYISGFSHDRSIEDHFRFLFWDMWSQGLRVVWLSPYEKPNGYSIFACFGNIFHAQEAVSLLHRQRRHERFVGPDLLRVQWAEARNNPWYREGRDTRTRPDSRTRRHGRSRSGR